MAGEPIPGSDAKQYKLTWSDAKEVGACFLSYLIDNNPNTILQQARRILNARGERVYFVHIVECGGRTLYYNRGF